MERNQRTMKIAKFLGSTGVVSTCGAAVLFAALCLPASAQTNYTFSEWATPSANSQPLHVVPYSSSQFFFTESAKDRIGELSTGVTPNTITEWTLPAGGLPHGIVVDATGNVVFCAYSGSYVGVLNPNATTKQLSAYIIPTPKSGSIHLDTTLSTAGTPIYFFSENLGNKVGMLDPNAQGGPAITEWAIPTLNAMPRGVSVGQGTQIYIAELAVHKIAMLDTSTNNITEWTIPAIRQVEHIHYYPSSSGSPLVYFGDLATSYVGVLDPIGNTVTLWVAPTPSADIPDVWLAGPSLVNFSERGGTKIGFLNTTLQAGTQKQLKPVTTMETPVVTGVTP